MKHRFIEKYGQLFNVTSSPPRVITDLEDFFALSENEKAAAFIGEKLRASYPIKECGESMVYLPEYLWARKSKIIFGRSHHGAQSLEYHYLRTTAAERLFLAEKKLSSIDSQLTFKITDTFRPIALQKKYFDEIYQTFQEKGLTGEELYHKVTQMIADPNCCPPHSTGGTVDLTIVNLENNEEMLMGSEVDTLEDTAQMFNPSVVGEMRQNRLLLYGVMSEAGFVDCPSEWWHYSYGDQEWAMRTGRSQALYDSYRGALSASIIS